MNQDAKGPGVADQLAGLVSAVLLIDPDGVIAEANPAAEDLLAKSKSRLAGMKASEALISQDERVEVALRPCESSLIARSVLLKGADQARRVDISVAPIGSHPGWRVLSAMECGSGTEEQHWHEIRAPAVLAHEIKNPLSAIRGAGQLLARRATARDKAMTEVILREVDRISELVDRMQRLGSGRSGEMASCNLHEAIRNAMATVRAGREGGIALIEEFDPSLPNALVDRSALEQALINLLSNACDACASSPEPCVIVRTRYASGQLRNTVRGGRATPLPLEITVSDNGPGIAADIADHVFEPFVSDKPHGQGLGLALVHKLMRDMGGHIAFERDVLRGRTLFHLHLAAV